MPQLIGALIVIGIIGAYWKWFLLIAALAAVAYGLVQWLKTQNQKPASPTPPAQRAPAKPAAVTEPATPVPNKPKPAPRKLETVRPPKARPHPATVAATVQDTTDNGRDQKGQTPASKPALPYAELTRTATAWPASSAVYTAIDLETTGLDGATDRIVEIGLVKFTADGTIIDEFATLVNNPGSSPGARNAHQIDDADLPGAPSTADALREAFAFMAGTVVVAHNWEFEEAFLIKAARQCALRIPDILAVCTMKTAQCHMDGRGYSLKIMYKSASGEFLDNAHTALADARAVSTVLSWMLRNSPQPLFLTAAPPPPAEPPYTGGSCPAKCRPAPMGRSSITALIDAFPQSPHGRTGNPEEVDNYLALLADCVEDGQLTYEETNALTAQVQRTQFTGTQIRELHSQAWNSTFPGDNDWFALDQTSRRERYLLADALGLTALAEEIHAAIVANVEPEPSAKARYLRGTRIGIAGDSTELIELRTTAEGYGAKIAVNITKTVQWMASVTPDATDSRHNSARKFGIPIVSPADGTKRIGEAVRDAELKAFERQREIDRMEADRKAHRAEQDSYWRPVWRRTELVPARDLTEPPDGSTVLFNVNSYRYLAVRRGRLWHTTSHYSSHVDKTEQWPELARKGTGFQVLTKWRPTSSEPAASFTVIRHRSAKTGRWDAAITIDSGEWYSTGGDGYLDNWVDIVRYSSQIDVAIDH